MHLPFGEAHNTRGEILEYLDWIERWLPDAIAAVPLDNPGSGFEWVPLSRMELHIYNIRHLQHHVGQLVDRLGSHAMPGVGWVGRWKKETAEG
jgi:hypothetical protein